MKKCKLVAAILFICSSITYGQTIRYVNLNTSCTSGCDGTSWSKAFDHLQDALDVAQSGNQIWVATGTYKPTTLPIGASSIAGDVLTERNHTFHLVSGVSVYGGFNGTELLLSDRDIVANETILSGDIGAPNTINDNIYHVVMSINDSSSTRLDGFSIKYGNSAGNDLLSFAEGESLVLPAGAGMHIHNSSLRIANCTFEGNNGPFFGGSDGGVLFISYSAAPYFLNIQFRNNTGRCISTYESSNVTLDRIKIIDNDAKPIFSYRTTTSLLHSEIRGNTTSGDLIFSNENLSIFNCLIAGNASLSNSEMIRPYCSTCNFTIQNSTITKNDYSSVIENRGTLDFVNNIVWDNSNNDIINESGSTTSISHCIIDDGIEDGNISYSSGTSNGGNNNDLNPQFEIPVPQSPSILGDLHLRATSSALNAGDNNYALSTDLDGNIRILGDTIDIGCYEYNPCIALSGNILYVDHSASGDNDGSSWGDAFITLTDALSVANQCSAITDVYIAEGVYYPDESINGDTNSKSSVFQVLRGISIVGGFPSGGSAHSLTNTTLYKTILSGDILQDDSQQPICYSYTKQNNINAENVIKISGSGTSTLDGLYITAGQANNNSGALRISGTSFFVPSVNIHNCFFSGNQTSNVVGSKRGGAIFSSRSNLTIINSIFLGNYADGNGGAIRFSNGGESVSFGIGNNTFAGNLSDANGHAISTNGIALFFNSIFYDNINNELDGNMITASNCNISGGWTGSGVNNININPLFESTGQIPNLHLQSNSACIDAGSNSLYTLPLIDLDHNPRIENGIVDMGAYEYKLSCSHPDIPALDSLFVHTDGPNWFNNSNWLQNCDPCTWFGITCDANNRVREISLTTNGLVGELPTEIGDLSELTTLRIRGNTGLVGDIPSEIGLLSNLYILDLSTNNHTGPIPLEIGSLNNLFFIWLHFNELTGSIPIELGNLSNINSGSFRIDGNQLSGCYDATLLNSALDPCRFSNAQVSIGNNFTADWDDFCICSAGICACNDVNVWLGGTGSWDDASKWSLNHIPLACEIVEITSSTDIVTMPANFESVIYLIEVDGGAVLEIPISSELHVRADPDFSNWTSCN